VGRTAAKDKPERIRRAGRVALLGRPNVGKSTLLNAALEQPLAIVSPTPQTTRDSVLGIVRHRGAEIALLDTPGLHRAKSALGRAMNRSAREAAKSADVIVFVTDVPQKGALDRLRKVRDDDVSAPIQVHPADRILLDDLPGEAPAILVINKVDRLRDKALLLPLVQAYAAVRPFASIVPISARRADGLLRVLDEVASLCPEGPAKYGADDLTDRPVRFFASEYVREQILLATAEEVPHAAAVEITRFVEPDRPGRATHVDATIHVERTGQKKILVGAGAEMLKRIGTAARLRIEELVGGKVNLKLFVRVTPGWRDDRGQLAELGYEQGKAAPAGPTAELADPEEPET
jgi:GTP-binding protein Era